MNWGVIGLGHMAKNFANSIQELDGSNLTGVSSRSLIKLIKFGYRYKIKPQYLYKLNHTHFELVQKCIVAKKNILCEKPLAVNLKQALEIKKSLNTSKIFFLEAIAYRSHPQINYVIDIIKENQIGKVIKIKSCFGFNAGAPNKKKKIIQ